jgi:hypothetical protein
MSGTQYPVPGNRDSTTPASWRVSNYVLNDDLKIF